VVVDGRLSETVRVLAMSSPSKRRVGCVLLRKGRVVVSTTNVEGKTHPVQADFASRAGEPFRRSLHAEIRALIRSVEKNPDTLIVGRVNSKGKLCLSRPCPVCQLAISESGIKTVYYSADDETWKCLELPT
jgi:deoxycytidylate deaminase